MKHHLKTLSCKYAKFKLPFEEGDEVMKGDEEMQGDEDVNQENQLPEEGSWASRILEKCESEHE